MPQMEFDVSCPGCDAVFSVPVELCGEMAECAECSAVFEIPRIDEMPPTLNTDTGAIKIIAAPTPGGNNNGAATNTIKLSRAGIGMIPTLKNSFAFGQNVHAEPDSAPSFTGVSPQLQPDAQTTPPQQAQHTGAAPIVTPPQTQAVPHPAHTTTSQHSAQQTTSAIQTSLSGQQIAQAVRLPSWTGIQLRQGEELQTCREVNKSPRRTAVLVSLPVLLTIVAVFFAKTQLILAFIIVLVLWIATFGIALLMTKDSSKRAIVITSQRTICIIGKDRIELKK